MGKRTTQRITLALAASLLGHGLLIALWPAPPETVSLSSGNSLTVSLLVRPVANAPANPVPVTPTPVTPHADKTSAPVTRNTTVSRPTPPAASQRPADPVVQHESPGIPTITAAASNELPQQEIASVDSRSIKLHLQDAFQNYFYYPRMAIRRGWYGEVQLGLRIEANGTLTRIRILQGSGYSLLDNAAMQSLARVQALPAAVSLLNGRSLDVVLPVEYRLL